MNVRLKRLQADYEQIKKGLHGHPSISIEGVSGKPPEKYRIKFNIRSLAERADGSLAEQTEHVAEVYLTLAYPRRAPQCRMLTPVFHPNIAPHAVCIGDHWAAGESLLNLIVRIGEMLAYQSYNTKSPLNGAAARWAEEHQGSLPTDPHDLSPQTREVDGTQAPRENRCENCGRGGESIRQCVCGRRVCPDCLTECGRCGKAYCLLCALESCDACGRLVCEQCRSACPQCKRTVCKAELEACAACGKQGCPDCCIECEECGQRVCLQHVVQCVPCRAALCPEHARRCSGCARPLCAAHGQACQVCGAVACPDCVFECDQCGTRVCLKHVGQCAECRKVMCVEHRLDCRACGLTFCPEHCDQAMGICVRCSSPEAPGVGVDQTHTMKCNSCGAKLLVRTDQLGKRCRCPRCGTVRRAGA